MKGHKYKAGGSIRNIGGIKAPRSEASSKVIDLAKGATTGTKPMDMDGVDGGGAKSRLDKPGRRRGGKC